MSNPAISDRVTYSFLNILYKEYSQNVDEEYLKKISDILEKTMNDINGHHPKFQKPTEKKIKVKMGNIEKKNVFKFAKSSTTWINAGNGYEYTENVLFSDNYAPVRKVNSDIIIYALNTNNGDTRDINSNDEKTLKFYKMSYKKKD